MRIVQITDSHISVDHEDRLQDLERTVQAVNEMLPDLVIHTGDVSHNALAAEYLLAREQLEKLHAPYWVMPGNKDDRSQLVQTFTGRLATHGEFIQYALEDYPVRCLVLDTVSGHSNKGHLCEARLQHIETLLAQPGSKPCLVFMHHTPFKVDEIPDPLQFEDWSVVDRLLAAFNACETLQSVHCGHVHRTVSAVIGGLPVKAITCIAGDLRKGSVTDEQRVTPVFELIEL